MQPVQIDALLVVHDALVAAVPLEQLQVFVAQELLLK